MYCFFSNSFLGLIIYMGFVKLPDIERYWSTEPPYHGLWARRFMTRKRFQAILSFLHVVNPDTEDPQDRLRKLRYLLDHFKSTCKKYFSPYCQVLISDLYIMILHYNVIICTVFVNILHRDFY